MWNHPLNALCRTLVVAAMMLAVGTFVAGCTEIGGDDTSQDDQADPDDYTEVDWAPTRDAGKADVVGIPATFNRNNIMNDALFTDTETITAADVQWFFEHSPYNGGGRSWLASEQVEGQPLSTVLYDVASERGLNPILLLARMQIEKGLVSKARPSQSQVNFALGCGCPDYRSCSPQFAGFANQLRCAGDVFAKFYDMSRNGSGNYRVGASRQSLDRLTISSANHATASFYAYTPWVLVGRGGNWLAWNITRKYLKHFDTAGRL